MILEDDGLITEEERALIKNAVTRMTVAAERHRVHVLMAVVKNGQMREIRQRAKAYLKDRKV